MTPNTARRCRNPQSPRANAAREKRGDRAEQDRRKCGDADRVRKDVLIDGNLARHLTDIVAHAESVTENGDTPGSDEQAQRASANRDEETLDEQLPDDAKATRPKSRPHGDLRLARGGAGQLQAGNVGAGDE
jgi:hypothetical protein